MFHNLISPAIDENKEISLNGSDATTGDSIIMPIDISTEATTRSMIRTYLYGPAVCCKPDVSDGGIGLALLYPAHE